MNSNTLPHLPRPKGKTKTMSRIEEASLARARAIAEARSVDLVDVVSAAVDLYDDLHGARVFLSPTPENEIITVSQARRAGRKGGSK